jgi:hypothetical protein
MMTSAPMTMMVDVPTFLRHRPSFIYTKAKTVNGCIANGTYFNQTVRKSEFCGELLYRLYIKMYQMIVEYLIRAQRSCSKI